MGTDFDDFVEGLQNQIFEETRAAYGDVAFQRWLKPQYMDVMDNPDGYGRITGSCSDTILRRRIVLIFTIVSPLVMTSLFF